MFTVNFSVTVPDCREGDWVFVTGNDPQLGEWTPTKALRLELQENNRFSGSVCISGVQLLKFRYFLGYYLHENTDSPGCLIIRKWETHLSARSVLPAVEASKQGVCRANVSDVFGFHAGREMVSDGWLLDDQQNAINLYVSGDALKFYKSKHVQARYRLKFTPFDVRNRDDGMPLDDDDAGDEPVAPILSYSCTEIAPLTKQETSFRLQHEFGEDFTNGSDYLLVRTFSVAVEYLGFRIEVFKADDEQPKKLAMGYALPSTLLNSYGKTYVPLLTQSGMPVGKIYLGYFFVRPMRVPHEPFKMDTSYIKHWKKRSTLEVGHRGMGNSYTRCAMARENTLHSLNVAARHGADYVEFDVQLTKDHIPVIFHDFHVMVSVAKRSLALDDKDMHQLAVKDLKLNQLRLLHLDHVHHHNNTPVDAQITKVTGGFDEEDDLRPFPTLVQALQNVSADVGFNVEIKFPMVQADGEHECPNYVEHNTFMDAILADVFLHAGHRRIVFSSFDPDVCMMIAAKQNKYPVLFLCCGANTRHQVYQDERTTTSLTAVNFAAGCGILGVNFHSEDVLRDPTPIQRAKQLGLISFVWGDELNDKSTVDHFKKVIGVDGVIYDRIGETDPRRNVFLLERAKKTEMFTKKPPSPVNTPRAVSVNHLSQHFGCEPETVVQEKSESRPRPAKVAPAEWPIPARRRSPLTSDTEEFLRQTPNILDGYLPTQLTTAREV